MRLFALGRYFRWGVVAAFVGLICLLQLLGAHTFANSGPVEPQNYRMEHYRSPTPATLTGAKVIGTAEVVELLTQGAIAVDTTPVNRTGYTDMTGRWNVAVERWNIAGSLWLPNIGYGSLEPDMELYFAENLARATASDPARLLIFYCYLDCWMSWNAAKRALEMGYSNVFWYPDGTDGWRDAGLPLVEGNPIPLFEDN